MVEAIRAGLRPSFGGLHDIRPLVRRAQVGGVLEAEELAETGETLRAIGDLDRWLNRIGDQFPRLGGLRQGVGEFSGLVAAIDGCLDSRAKVLDTASRRLSAVRREIAQVEERIQETLRHMLRSRRDPAQPPLPQFHDGGAPLRPAGLQGPSRRDRGLGPPHQRQQRDGLHRAAGDRREVGPALVPPRPRGEGDPPDPAMAQRPGRPGGRQPARHAGDHGRARPDPRPGPAGRRLPDDAPRTSTRRAGSCSGPPGIPARGALPGRSGDRPTAPSRASRSRAVASPTASRRPPAPAGCRIARRHRAEAADGRADRREPRAAVPHAGDHRAEHRRQDGGPQDGRPAGGHGPVRAARPGRRGLRLPGLRRRPGRHRRRAEPGAVAVHVLLAHPADQRDPGQGHRTLAGAARRDGGRHRPRRRRRAGPGDPRRARPRSAAGRS